MITWQDYERAGENKTKWLRNAITSYRNSKEYKQAMEEEKYMAGKNTAIMEVMRVIYNMAGLPEEDFTKNNVKIRNRMIHRLVTDRCSYSLGNGVSFKNREKVKNEEGKTVIIDKTKDLLGDSFDTAVYKWGYWACANGASWLYVHPDGDEWKYTLFKKTGFLPLPDEKTNVLRGGVRFWSIEWGKRPITAVVYEEAGYTRYETPDGKYGINALEKVDDLKPYIETVEVSEAYGEEVVGSEPLPTLPIFPLYSGENKEGALDNMKAKLDAYDMILSGFANDIGDCAQVYWLISGATGMTPDQKRELLDRLILQHMAVVDGENAKIQGFTQEIPHEARKVALETLRKRIYEDYGGFDTEMITAAGTNDHIAAMYWPMDEEADSFEEQLIESIKMILNMLGVKDMPLFTRNKVSNQKEQTEMVMLAAGKLDERTILKNLPFITVDEIDDIIAQRAAEASETVVPDLDENEE